MPKENKKYTTHTIQDKKHTTYTIDYITERYLERHTSHTPP